MCFYNDYNWYASVTEETNIPATEPFRCDECGRTMPAGSTRRYVYQQEHETCYDCDDEDPDHQHNYGETNEYTSCDECRKMLAAIEIAEIEDGCDPAYSHPGLTGMVDAIIESRSDSKKYFQAAAKASPELVSSGYLGWLWRRMSWVSSVRDSKKKYWSLNDQDY